jgi:hypothetical protein
MRHFYRSHMELADVLAAADDFFPKIGLAQHTTAPKTRTYTGQLVQVETDQMGESRLDRNVKKFFVALHRADDPAYRLTSSY